MVLKAQQQKHIPLGQALVSLGALDQNRLAEHLKSFNAQLKAATADDVALPAYPSIWGRVRFPEQSRLITVST